MRSAGGPADIKPRAGMLKAISPLALTLFTQQLVFAEEEHHQNERTDGCYARLWCELYTVPTDSLQRCTGLVPVRLLRG